MVLLIVGVVFDVDILLFFFKFEELIRIYNFNVVIINNLNIVVIVLLVFLFL